MTQLTGDFSRTSLLILDRYYLDSPECKAGYRGMGRFLRDMREAGFGAMARSLDVVAVDATTGFTRYHGDVAAYTLDVVARNPHHVFTAQRGFELIGAEKWVACTIALKRYGQKLGSTAALVRAAGTGDAHIRRIASTVRMLDIEEMADRRAVWLRARPESVVVPHEAYRDFFHDHVTKLRRRAA